jgi:hypothetical protein
MTDEHANFPILRNFEKFIRAMILAGFDFDENHLQVKKALIIKGVVPA